MEINLIVRPGTRRKRSIAPDDKPCISAHSLFVTKTRAIESMADPSRVEYCWLTNLKSVPSTDIRQSWNASPSKWSRSEISKTLEKDVPSIIRNCKWLRKQTLKIAQSSMYQEVISNSNYTCGVSFRHNCILLHTRCQYCRSLASKIPKEGVLDAL